MAKSQRNKTLDISVEEGKEFFDRCLQGAGDDQLTFTDSIEKITDKTINGDTLKIMERLPSEFVDLAIIDPPYNLSKTYAENKFSAKDRQTYFEYTLNWITKLLPCLKKNASFYICCDWKSSMVIADVLCSLEDQKKLIIQNRITWQREKGRGAKANWKNSMEDIWFCTINNEFTFNLDAVKLRRKVIAPYKVNGVPKDWNENEDGNFRDTCPGNFWDDISIPFWSMAENTAHPTQKPEKLIAKMILASSNPGDFVFDPFLGSGTSSVTAKKLGRHYLGIEQSPQYCTWAEKRLADADIDKSIQGYSEGVFWERNSGR
ncbi:DNA methyltransferase [Treponema sp.]|uniref:DNA-methyltransferase n=1 Tax=Treponema sp. TaxID=166 RepID=UPI0025D212C8|nr:DNA methyltransferase [Treponema sp.]MCR5217706.1 site-specific DNA-methyltransferase [Treponema sp.]